MNELINHKRLMRAYLLRIRTSDLEALLKASKAGDYAGMQLGLNAQVQASRDMNKVIDDAFDGLCKYDLEMIDGIVKEEVNY